jgi:hypothetical protein
VFRIYQDFEPAVKALMSKVDPSAVKVWQLLDMEKLPTWIAGKLVLLGDAAHPFTPRRSLSAVVSGWVLLISAQIKVKVLPKRSKMQQL